MKNFKLVSEADDSYHIQHKNGKTFTVEKKGLNKKAHEAIQKLASGGNVDSLRTSDLDRVKSWFGGSSQGSSDQSESKKQPPAPDKDKVKQYGFTQNFDEGGTAVPAALDPGAPAMQTPSPAEVLSPDLPAARSQVEMSADADRQATIDQYNRMANTTDQMFLNGKEPQNFDPKLWQNAQRANAVDKIQQQKEAENQALKIQQTNQSRIQAGLAPLPMPEGISAVQESQAASGQPMSQPSSGQAQFAGFNPDEQQDPLSQFYASQNKGTQQQQADVQNYIKDMDRSGSASNQAFADYFKQASKLETPEQIFARHDAANKELLTSIVNNKIDPNRYINNMSTGSKILAGIAMALGGAAAGGQGVNQAAQHFQKTIDADINAQINDQSKNMNLYKMNREHANDEVQARLMTQNQMMTMVQAKLAMAGAASQNAERRLNAQNMVRQLQQQIDGNNLQLGLQGGGAKQAGPGGLSQQDPSVYAGQLARINHWTPEQQKAVGDQIDIAKSVVQSKNKLLDAFDKAAQESKSVSSMAGYTPGSVSRLHQTLAPTFKDVEGTVRQAAMDNTFENITPKWNDTPDRLKERRQALLNYIDSKQDSSLARQLGLNLQNFAATAKQEAVAPGRQMQTMEQNYMQANRNNPDPTVQKRVQFLAQKYGNQFGPGKTKNASGF